MRLVAIVAGLLLASLGTPTSANQQQQEVLVDSSSSSSSCLLDANGECTHEIGVDGSSTLGGITHGDGDGGSGNAVVEAEATALPHEEVNVVIDTGYGEPQRVQGPHADGIRVVIHRMHQYMRSVVYNEEYPYKDVRAKCLNKHELCAFWSAIGECDKNAVYMKISCAPACQSCEALASSDTPVQEGAAADGEHVDVGYGARQLIKNTHAEAIRQVLAEMDKYMRGVVHNDTYSYKDIVSECRNKEDLCAHWAAIGECDNNPNYMKTNCAPACRSCEHLSFDYRCPLPDHETLAAQNVWRPGDLNAMFERIVQSEEYTNKTILSRQPWVIIMDDFLTAEECDRLIELGGQEGYQISRDVGPRLPDGTYDGIVSAGRTSTNAWCAKDCYNDPITKRVLDKLERLTGIPEANSEHLQLLRYQETQFYEVHHDYIEHDIHRGQGVRILTVFLYLNDVVAGGGTRFPRLNLTVLPQRGRALIWPSVFDDQPEFKDISTEHEALPVVEGIKYGANAWFHQRDFKISYQKNCV